MVQVKLKSVPLEALTALSNAFHERGSSRAVGNSPSPIPPPAQESLLTDSLHLEKTQIIVIIRNNTD